MDITIEELFMTVGELTLENRVLKKEVNLLKNQLDDLMSEEEKDEK